MKLVERTRLKITSSGEPVCPWWNCCGHNGPTPDAKHLTPLAGVVTGGVPFQRVNDGIGFGTNDLRVAQVPDQASLPPA
jgi:hypothetical protein